MKTFNFKVMKNKLFLMMLALCGVFMLSSCSDDDDDNDVAASKVPQAYVEALAAKFPEAANVEWENKGAYLVADFTKDFRDYEVWFDSSAKWSMTNIDCGKDLFFIPGEVSKAFAESEYGTWTVDDIESYERANDSFYVIEVEKVGNSDTDIYYRPDGELIKAVVSDNAEITPVTVL